jgi:hypothetical protein
MKPKPPGARARKPDKRCYELTSAAMSYPDARRLTLIHGAKIIYDLLPIPHAWLFDPTDDMVFDTAEQRWIPLADYPGIERVRYTQLEAATLASETGHCGPWDY